MHDHPVKLVVEDDLRRSRLTVFFRLILAIPHFIWLFLWSIGAFFAAIANWLATLVRGTPPTGLHRFMCSYIRYQAHLTAYVSLTANPYPGFLGEEGSYPIDLKLPEPGPQKRWSVFFRFFIALPALVISGLLGGTATFRYGTSFRNGSRRTGFYGGGYLTEVCAVLGWFASLALGRMPKGLRDASAYSIGYGAQASAYLLLVTDRYPDADPVTMLLAVDRPPEHPVRVVGDPHDLRRSRVTVFFRLLLAIPHIVWLYLWQIAVDVAVLVNWFITLFRGSPARPLHRFVAAWARQRLHVIAFLSLTANPFPGFTGEYGTYPLDLELPEPARQNRWKTGFRIVLAVPAVLVDLALLGALVWAALFTWFYALVRGSAPWGFRNLSAYVLRYDAQTAAYVLLLTDAYPNASPLEGAPSPQHEFAEVS